MTPGIRPLLASNWKMNGKISSLEELRVLDEGFHKQYHKLADIVIFPPATLLAQSADILRSSQFMLGGQDCSVYASGSCTGDISAGMLADAGASYVIVGHSERRAGHGESNDIAHAKAKAAWSAGLTAIICIGETLDESETGETFDVLTKQINGSIPKDATAQNTVIAYEPVWAIGSGKIPTDDEILKTHAHIRSQLKINLGENAAKMHILYGGSVTPQNINMLLSILNVDGALIGRAAMTGIGIITLVNNLFH